MPKVEAPKLVASSTIPSISISAEALGTPGARMTLHIVPQFAQSRKTDAAVLLDATRRAFIVAASLSKAPSIAGRTGHIKGDFGEKDGDSYLTIPPSVDQLRIDTPWGRFHIKKNGIGELSLAELECLATTPPEARTMFIDAVYPVLDHLSYAYNVAMFITMIRVFDVTHQSTHVDCVGPYRHQVIANSMSRLFDEMKPAYAMYREGKNADSDFYKFLCFYKIMEGLLGKMRASAFARAKKAGLTPQIERDLVPDNNDLSAEIRAYAGKPIKAFFDEFLTSRFRNAVAHFQTNNGVLHVSSSAELYAYANLAFVTDLCARVLIATHERLLAQLGG